MKKNFFAKGCIFLMLLCVTGCGASDVGQGEPAVTEEVTEDLAEDTEETTEDVPEEPDTEELADTEDLSDTRSSTQEFGELSDDLYSYQLLINGELYQLPMDVETLVERGWELDGDIDGELDAYTLDPMLTFYRENCEIQVSIANETGSPQPYRACTATAMSISLYYNTDGNMTFVLPKGIQSGVSTVEDMKAAYGEPTSFSESDGMAFADYEVEYASKYVSFTFNENRLVDIKLANEDF